MWTEVGHDLPCSPATRPATGDISGTAAMGTLTSTGARTGAVDDVLSSNNNNKVTQYSTQEGKLACELQRATENEDRLFSAPHKTKSPDSTLAVKGMVIETSLKSWLAEHRQTLVPHCPSMTSVRKHSRFIQISVNKQFSETHDKTASP